MCECLHRARASKISLKNVASTPTFSLSIGDVFDVRICFHRFRDLAQGDTGTGDERFKQDVA